MSTADSSGTGRDSPEGASPSLAIRPSALAGAQTSYETSRRVSQTLREEFEALRAIVEPEVGPADDRPQPDKAAGLRLAECGSALAEAEQETCLLEQKMLHEKMKVGQLSQTEGNKLILQSRKRYISAGDDLWRNKKSKFFLADSPTTSMPLFNLGSIAASECLLALYAKSDGADKRRRRPSNWRRDAMHYYGGETADDPPAYWCHMLGIWVYHTVTKAAHIVPFFLDNDSISEILFGEWAPSIKKPGNALLLSEKLEIWFDQYHIVVVPVDTNENPITRWRTDVISDSILHAHCYPDITARDIDGKELTFLNANRPAARFLYFHFIMALLRIRDLQREGWQTTWARYYTQRPFPTPKPYIRESMLIALATHFKTTDLKAIDSWIHDHGFTSNLPLHPDASTEAARRVYEALELDVEKANKRDQVDEEEEEEEGEEGEEEGKEEG
ncbi:hypothetical protein E4U43_002516 [Claviceps pusilla]|uniref:HNH nuclease domain-containing protein n=1 Tax=Claviceps pusilla TaxID=123648 RepID=A0A9P7NIZ3_9HYPO|nr:hypothetical protein E4U43_002516 [Claviceps pusilla]